YLANHVQGEFDQVHRGGLVGNGYAAEVGRDVRHDEVRLAPSERVEQLLEDGILGEVALDEVDVVQRVHRQNIGGHDPTFLAHQPASHLGPATGCGAEIHHQHAGAYQLVLLVQLD